jgi:hypothetical protein
MMKKTAAWIIAAAAVLSGTGLSRAQTGGFRFDGLLSRVITPNNDGLNDRSVFCFENFGDSDIEGRIYTAAGAEVARLERIRTAFGACPGGLLPQHMIWDGRQNGSLVTGGVYVYQIRAEGLMFTGSILVVR